MSDIPPRRKGSDTAGYTDPLKERPFRHNAISESLINYEMPSVVRAVAQGWKETIIMTGLVASICAIVHAILLHLSAITPITPANSTLTKVLHWFIYASLVLQLGATASSVLSLVMLSDLNSYARQTAIQDPESLPAKVLRGEHLQASLFVGNGEIVLLRGFGLGRIWELARSHMMICFILGMLSSFVEIALWVWSLEIIQVSIAVVVPLGLIVLPPFLVFMYLFVGK